jgi:hypothetical protein
MSELDNVRLGDVSKLFQERGPTSETNCTRNSDI